MKKSIMLLTAIAVLVGSFTGCGKSKADSDTKSVSKVASTSSVTQSSTTKKKLSVVCTIFPEYDWVREVIGDKKDNYDITYLMEKGVDLHSYRPTAEDIAKIKACDLFVYVGGESDGWVKDTLKESTNKNMQVINLLEALGNNVKEEEVVEGMQGDHDHDHDHEDKDHDHDHDDKDHDHDHEDEDHDHNHDEEGPEYDEHVWLSLRNASALVNEIASKLQVIDPENKSTYATNAANYTAKLTELDSKYIEAVNKSSKNTVLFGDRFPFRYLVEDYKLKYFAAFVGCSAETEASFETVAFLAKKVDELKLSNICVIENSNEKIAKTIIENTANKNQKIVVMNSMQSVTTDDINNGLTYYSVMEENLNSLKKALK